MKNLRFQRNTLINNTAKLIFIRYAAIPLNLITGILLARVLGPKKLGIYALMMWLPGILAGPMSLGIGNANLYFASKDEKFLKPLIANSLWISILFPSVIMLITFQVLLTFPSILPKGLNYYHIIIPLLQIPFRFFIMFSQNIFNARDEQSYFRKVELIQQMSYFLLCVGGYILLNIDLWGFVNARILSLVIPCLYIFIVMTRRNILCFRINFRLFLDSVTYGIKIQCSSFARQFSQKIDELIVLKFAGPVSLGYLNICRNNVNRLRIIPYSLATVIVPRLKNDNKDAALLTAKSIRILLCFISIILIITAFIIGYIIPIFYGAAYNDAVFPMRIMLFLLLPLCIQRIITFYLMINNYTAFLLKTSLITAIVLIACDFSLIPEFGLIGAIIAGILASFLESIILAIFFIRLTGVPSSALLIPQKNDFQYLFWRLIKGKD